MSVSCITRIPDFEKLDIPEKQRRIHVSDEQIFQKLQMQYRQITDQQDGAVKGDYVLTDVIHADGKTKRVHIELGGKAFKNYQDALLGCKSGQEISVAGIVLRVLAVRKIIAFPLTDEAIQSLNISNITTVTGYRKNYLQNHGDEIADRVFHALQPKLISNVLALAQFILDPEEVDAYNGRQRVMLQNISGDVDARILKAFGSDGKKTLDECYQCYYEENKRNFMIYLWGKALAEEDYVSPSDAEYSQALTFYCLAFDTTEERVEQDGLREEVLRSFYINYGIGKLRDYYKSIVSFLAAGIPSLPLKAEPLT